MCDQVIPQRPEYLAASAGYITLGVIKFASEVVVFSHVFVGVSDFERALAFYNPLMESLGIEARFCERSRPWAG